MTLTPDLFARSGEALFGAEWKRPLAVLIGMNERTVFRIAKAAKDGEAYQINETLAPVLANLLRERARTATAQAHEAERLAKLLE